MNLAPRLHLALGFFSLVPAGLGAAPAAEPRLFADDAAIETMSGLTRRVNALRKHGTEPVLRPERPWENMATLPMAVFYDDEEHIFKMWYRPGAEKFHLAYATSRDGVTWDRPALHLVTWHGSDDNNLLSLVTGVGYNGIFKDRHESDPARRYKYFGYGWKGGKRVGPPGICVYFSPDGFHWQESPANPALFGIGDSHSPMGWDERISRYVAFIKPAIPSPIPGAVKTTGNFWTQGIRIINRSTSEDMMHWSPMETVLAPDEDDPPNTHFYGISVFPDRGLYFGLLWVYHPNALMIDVQLALSRDSIHWQRAGRRHPILSYGLPNQFDSHVVIALKPILVGDRYLVYYLAEDAAHGLVSARETYPVLTVEPRMQKIANFEYNDWTLKRRGFVGLAEFPRDRLVSVDADEGRGELVTKPFALTGRQVRVNANAEGGEVRVEILDAGGQPIPGYGGGEAQAASGDSANHLAAWKGGSDLSALQGKEVKLRIIARHARLYSFKIEP